MHQFIREARWPSHQLPRSQSPKLHDPDDTESSVINVPMSPSPEGLEDNPSLVMLFAGDMPAGAP
jgi:hypothetical protein